MSWPVYFLISGSGTTAGLLMSVFATLLTLHRGPTTLRFAFSIHLFGVLLILLSSPQVGVVGHVLTIGCPLIAMLLARQAVPASGGDLEAGEPRLHRRRYAHDTTVVIAVLLNARQLDNTLISARMPKVVLADDTAIHVIGDSLSASSDNATTTWPELLEQQLGHRVVVHARVGATTAAALKQAKELPDECCVLIEIGGNDLLGGEPSSRFADDLRALLNEVCSQQRTAVMFELPLPPFCNGYARTQSLLSSEFDVPLISRHVLAEVLCPEENTVDSLHLSAAGHRDLADRIESLFTRPPAATR